MAGAEGFEPSNAGSKDRCLTAWPRPILSQGPLTSSLQGVTIVPYVLAASASSPPTVSVECSPSESTRDGMSDAPETSA